MEAVVSSKKNVSKIRGKGAGKVLTNWFLLSSDLERRVYLMRLYTEPSLPKEKGHYFQELLESAKEELSKIFGVNYRSRNLLYAFKGIGEDVKHTVAQLKEFKLIAEQNATFLIKDIYSQEPEESQQAEQFLNILLKNKMHGKEFNELGKRSNYFKIWNSSKSKTQSILTGLTLADYGLVIQQGFKITMNAYTQAKLMLCIDTAFRISSTKNLWEDYCEKTYKKPELQARFIDEEVIGYSFLINNDLNRMVKIDRIIPSNEKTLSSDSPIPEHVSLKKYFESKFQWSLSSNNQLIAARVYRKRITVENVTKYVEETEEFPSETLFRLGLTVKQKGDYRVMNDIAEYTKLSPKDRFKEIKNMWKEMKLIDPTLKIELASSSNCHAFSQVLDPPKIKTGSSGSFIPLKGIINFNGPIVAEYPIIKDWAVIYESDGKFMNQFLNSFYDEAKRNGVEISEDPEYWKINEKSKFIEYKKAVEDLSAKGYKFFLFLVSKPTGNNKIMTNTGLRRSIYDEVKVLCDTKLEVISQFVIINEKNLVKKGFVKNIVRGVSSKLGFPLWYVERPDEFSGKSPTTMIVGADVFHSKGKNSVAAVIGTRDNLYSVYTSLSSVQNKKGDELMKNIGAMILSCIDGYKECNKGKIPERILYYRDGVGDNMIGIIKKDEIDMIIKSVISVYGDKRPKLTVILVTKRVSKKIFETDSKDNIYNPWSGTIVNNTITKQDFEWYMIAQNVTQGTATPTRYQILLNECNFTQESLEKVSYFQTFNYYNWTGAVKVPAVCQYAHKLAYHVGEHYSNVKIDKNKKSTTGENLTTTVAMMPSLFYV